MELGGVGDVQPTSNGGLSVICGRCGDIRVYGEYSGDYDEEGGEDHCIEGGIKDPVDNAWRALGN